MSQLNLLTPFNDAVLQSQQVFRHLLKAMSEPGTVIDLTKSIQKKNATAIYPTVWAVAQSLLDSETTVFVSPELATQAVIQSIQFHTDASVVNTSFESNFAIISLENFTSLTDFHCGSVVNPHLSTTVILQVDDLTVLEHHNGDEACLSLSGPGIRDQHYLQVAGFTSSHIELLQSNHGLYPCGIDLVLCSPTHICAIARSTSINGRVN